MTDMTGVAQDPEVSDGELHALAWKKCLGWIVDPPDRSAFVLAERIVRRQVGTWAREARASGEPQEDIATFRTFLDRMKAEHEPHA